MGTTSRRPDFDLPSDDPVAVFSAYDRLRSNAPVAYTDDLGGYWAMTSYVDVRAAASDSRTFISSVKAVVPSDPRGVRRPPLNFDAPRHTPFRRALSRTLAAPRLAELVAGLQHRADALFDSFVEGSDPDIARSFGTLLPAYAAASWLNLDDDRAEWLASTATAWVDAWRRQAADEVTHHSELMYAVARWLVSDRRTSPRDPTTDPASSLLAERDGDGEPLTDDLVVGALRQSLVVGMVAPPLLIGAMALHLAQDHTLHRDLRTGRASVRAAAEEFIRLYTPYRGFARTVSRPIVVGGVLLEPGEPVTLVYAAANRDPQVFPEPQRFLPDRPNIDRHLGFGHGHHQCVGQHLARGIVVAALSAMTGRAERLELLGLPEPTRMPELGYQSVRVAVVR